MLYIFGDSHANFCFRDLTTHIPVVNCFQNSITLHRVGRDRVFPNFNPSFNTHESIFMFLYGEVDCRCHINTQLKQDRTLDEICSTLTQNLIQAIKTRCNLSSYPIIICSVVPPVRQQDYEAINGPITHDLPFRGTDEERVLYTQTLNDHLKKACEQEQFVYFDIYSLYANEQGLLDYHLTDQTVHIQKNQTLLQKFNQFLTQDIRRTTYV